MLPVPVPTTPAPPRLVAAQPGADGDTGRADRRPVVSLLVPGGRLPGRYRVSVWLVAVFYVAVTVAVVTGSPLVRLDWAIAGIKPARHVPQLLPFLSRWVVLGQRGPALLLAGAWLAVRFCRTRDWRPMLLLGWATLLLNVSVGAVKLLIGRLGPAMSTVPGSAEVFHGGTLFPSGHTSNAVVTWGVLAYVACRHRRLAAGCAATVAVTVGVDTLYLGTHWLSDVLAGMAAGGLVLFSLPVVEPAVAMLCVRLGRVRRPAGAIAGAAAGAARRATVRAAVRPR